MAPANDQVGDAGGHQQIPEADQGRVAKETGHYKDVTQEPEPARLLKQDVQGIEPVSQDRERGGTRFKTRREQDRHPAAEVADDHKIREKTGTENQGARDAAIEPDDAQQEDGTDDVQWPRGVDRRRRAGGTE